MRKASEPVRDLALLYIRLSFRGYGDEVSPEIQLNGCAEDARRYGVTYSESEVYDEGEGHHSARNRDNLPAWEALYERALTDPRVAAVFCYDLARGFRYTIAIRQVAEELDKHGVKLIFHKEGLFDIRTAHGKFTGTMHAAAAEWYAHTISEKMQEHYAKLRAKGVYTGHRAPLGLNALAKRLKCIWKCPKQLMTTTVYSVATLTVSLLGSDYIRAKILELLKVAAVSMRKAIIGAHARAKPVWYCLMTCCSRCGD